MLRFLLTVIALGLAGCVPAGAPYTAVPPPVLQPYAPPVQPVFQTFGPTLTCYQAGNFMNCY